MAHYDTRRNSLRFPYYHGAAGIAGVILVSAFIGIGLDAQILIDQLLLAAVPILTIEAGLRAWRFHCRSARKVLKVRGEM